MSAKNALPMSLQLVENTTGGFVYSNRHLFVDSEGQAYGIRCGWESDDRIFDFTTQRHLNALRFPFSRLSEGELATEDGPDFKKAKRNCLLLFGDCPILGGRIKKNCLVFADFDQAPEEYGFRSHADLQNFLSGYFYTSAVVFPSVRKKTKVAFVVSRHLSQSERLEFLASVIPVGLFKKIDTSVSGCSRSFITEDAASVLFDGLRKANINRFVGSVTGENSENHVAKVRKTKLDECKQDLEPLYASLPYKLTKSEKAILSRLFARSKKSVGSGLWLCQQTIAEEIGVNRRTIIRSYKKLVEKGLIKPGKKVWLDLAGFVPRYVLSGLAYDYAVGVIIPAYEGYKQKANNPKNIVMEDGNTNKVLYKLAFYFPTEDDFLDEIRGREIVQRRPELIEEARSAWRHRVKRYGELS